MYIHIYETPPEPEASRNTAKEGGRSIRDFAVGLCLLGMSEATPIKSHQNNCLN